MLKTISAFGVIAILALAGVAFVGTGPSGRLMAREKPVACTVVDAPIDEGYGVTRRAPQAVCTR